MKLRLLCVFFISFLLLNCTKELHSEIAETHSNGAKKKEIYYYTRKSDPRRIILYSPDGQIMSDRFMKRGKPDSLMVIYHPNGKKYKEVTYIQDKSGNEMIHGKETTWYENGNIRSEVIFKQGIPQGSAFTYYDDGAKESETPYNSNGQKHGNETLWYANGTVKETTPYSNGDIHGIKKEYYQNGKCKKEYTYVKNVLAGICKTYFENGKLQTECTYKDGKLEGLKQEWYPSGKLAAKATYENGELIKGTRY